MIADAALQPPDRPDAAHVVPLDASSVQRRIGVKSAVALPPPPLLLPAAGFCAAWLEQAHGAAYGRVGALGCWMLPDGLLGGRCFAGLDEGSVTAPDIMPLYLRTALAADTVEDAPHRQGRRVRRVRGTVASIGTIGYDTFGHWPLDILPRLWTLRETLGRQADTMRYAFPADLPVYARKMLTALGIPANRLETYDRETEILRVDTLVLPSMAHEDYRFHPAASRFFDAVVSRLAPAHGETPARIFLSRAGWSGGAAATRRIVNGAEIAELLTALGFVTVHPETMTWPEQVALFAGARVVVGEHGSAMKNLLFAPPTTAVINLHFLNMTQTGIAALRGHRMMYLDSETDEVSPDGVVGYRIDPGKLLACVDAAVMATQ